MSVWAVLVAAGRGERLGEDRPKAFVRLGDLPLLAEPLRRLDESAWIDAIVVVAPPEWEEPTILLAEELGASKVRACVTGGETRTDSVRAGVAEVPDDAAVILVHDAARPLLPDERRRAPDRGARARASTAPCPACRVADTVKRVRTASSSETLDRDELVTVQTPQAFVAPVLRAALRRATRAHGLRIARRGGRRPGDGRRGRRAAAQGDDARRPRAGRGMAVEAVVFDVGETLVDETGMWERAAAVAGVTPFTLMGVLGGLAARGEHHDDVWQILEVEHPAATWEPSDFYPDALACLDRLRAARSRRRGGRQHAARDRGDAAPARRPSSARRRRWGVAKPAPEFFARVIDLIGVEPEKIAYVGDRVDNDVGPALAAGMVGVHIKRGPWGLPARAAARGDPHPFARRAAGGAGMSFRVGIGVDAHALADGVPLVLGGVALDHPRGLAGHSDGDVLAHALTDALLGAAGLATSARSSRRTTSATAAPTASSCFARRTGTCARRAGRSSTPTACSSARSRRSQRTASEMRARLSDAVGGGEVNVRATTTDQLGFTGRGEGLAAHAVALLER